MVGCRVLLGECIQGACVQVSNGGNVCVELGNGLLDGGGLQGEVCTRDVAAGKSAPRHRMQTWTCQRQAGRAAVRLGAPPVAGPVRGVSGIDGGRACSPSVRRVGPGPSCAGEVTVGNKLTKS
jgi:hypothetical protein